MIDGNDGKEYLFPSIKECILDVNLERGRLRSISWTAFWTCKEYIIYEFHILTLFPEMVTGGLNTSITGRAMEKGPDIGGGRQYPGLFHRQAPACRRLSLTAAEPVW